MNIKSNTVNKNQVKIVRSSNSWIESAAVDQLMKISTLEGIVQAVGMPDLHPGKTPVGAVYKTEKTIYPHIIGNDIGCGIALFNTSLKKHKFNTSKVVKKFSKYQYLSDIEIEMNHDLSPYQLVNKLGTIGSGNHFGEFQAIHEVIDQEAFDALNLNAKQVYLLVHSGSRNYGDYILEHIFNGQVPTEGIKVDTALFETYMEAHNKALDFAELNRRLIAERVLSVVQNANPERVFESVHNSISYEAHQGEKAFIHRKGAAPSNVGPLVIAGTRETESYIVIPNPDLPDYLNAISHGAGRKWHRSGCKDRLINRYGKKSIKSNTHQSLICNNKDLFYEEAPDAYKNINQVIQDLVDHKMIRVVATLNPLLTVKI